MQKVSYNIDEIGLLSLIAAMYADAILSSPDTDDALKAVALKARSNVRAVPNDKGGAYYETGTYSIHLERR